MTRRIVGILLATLVLAGCAPSGGLVVERSDERTLMRQSTEPAFEYQALVGGQLTVMESGCVGVTAGGQDNVTIFPPDTTFTDRGITIRSTEYALGDTVSFSGGWIPYEHYQDVLPAECVSAEVAVITDPN